ncbi:unnamed protein product, partial [Dovyalis caffra]
PKHQQGNKKVIKGLIGALSKKVKSEMVNFNTLIAIKAIIFKKIDTRSSNMYPVGENL